MEDTLKRLLDAERRAQVLVDQAIEDRDRMIEQARDEVRLAEEGLDLRIPELRSSLALKAEERARQTVAELQRRFQERKQQLEVMAQASREDAVEAAMGIVLDPKQG